MRLFSKFFGGPKESDGPISVTATLNCRLMPLDRGEFFEDPLNAFLESQGLGSATGGGTMQNSDGSIAYCDVEISLAELSDATLSAVVGELERLGAPMGSKIVASDGETLREFGEYETLSLSLDGIGLSPEIYEAFDTDEFVERIDNILNGLGSFQGSQGLAERTEFYFSGKSYLEMENRIEATIGQFPICNGAIVTQVK